MPSRNTQSASRPERTRVGAPRGSMAAVRLCHYALALPRLLQLALGAPAAETLPTTGYRMPRRGDSHVVRMGGRRAVPRWPLRDPHQAGRADSGRRGGARLQQPGVGRARLPLAENSGTEVAPDLASAEAQRKGRTRETPDGRLPLESLPDLLASFAALAAAELEYKQAPGHAIPSLSVMTKLPRRAFDLQVLKPRLAPSRAISWQAGLASGSAAPSHTPAIAKPGNSVENRPNRAWHQCGKPLLTHDLRCMDRGLPRTDHTVSDRGKLGLKTLGKDSGLHAVARRKTGNATFQAHSAAARVSIHF